jgi:hypothetical protein
MSRVGRTVIGNLSYSRERWKCRSITTLLSGWLIISNHIETNQGTYDSEHGIYIIIPLRDTR